MPYACPAKVRAEKGFVDYRQYGIEKEFWPRHSQKSEKYQNPQVTIDLFEWVWYYSGTQ